MRSFPQSIQGLVPARRSGAYTNLDIGPDAIVAVACGPGGASSGPACLRALPPGVVADGEVSDPEALAHELRELVSEHGLPRDARVGLAHSRLVVRTLELPANLAGAELAAAVRHFAEGLLPMSLDEVALDHRRTGLVPGRPDQQRVLFAAARLDGVERLMRALDLAGLRPRQVQLCGLALLRALDAPPLRDEAVLFVQAGGLTNVVVAEDGEPALVRVASAGSEAIATGLAERAGLTHVEARRHAALVGVSGGDDVEGVEPDAAKAAQRQVREGLHRIVAEVHSSLEFYSSQEHARPVGAAVITGAMTAWPGVAEALSDELGLTVLPASRDEWAGIDCGGVAPEALDVAVGLALASGEVHPDLRPVAIKREYEASSSPRFAQALCGVSAAVAAAMVYFVIVSNQLTDAEDRTARIAADSAVVEREVAALKPYADFATAAEARRTAVATVAAGRFDWARVLRQLSEVTPSSVWLTSLKGTLTPTTQIEGGAGAGSTAALRGVRMNPAIEVVGCAVREGRVPDYMDRLRGIGNATEVGFSRAERLEKQAGAAAGGGGGSGDCRNGDDEVPRFDLVTFFKPVGGAVAAAPAPGTAPAPGVVSAPVPTQTASAKETP